MSAIRSISIFTLILILTFQSSFANIGTIADEDIAIHSVEELTIPAEILHHDIASDRSNHENKALKMSIQDLLLANAEYAKRISHAGDGTISDYTGNNTISPVEFSPRNIFDNFLETSGTGMLSGNKSQKIQLTHSARKEKKIRGISGTIAVNIATGTIISSASGDSIDPTTIGLYTATSIEQTKANNYQIKKNKRIKKGTQEIFAKADVFEFGIPGTHLVFSRPVTLSIMTPGYSDGAIVDLAVLHAGNTDFNTGGLSMSSDTLCSTDGLASKPGSQGVIRNGRITFYTCGASSFTMNAVGGKVNSNDLKLVIGDYGQVQVYYNGLTQVYGGNPPSSGAGGPTWPRLRIGTINVGNGANAWTTTTTTGSQVGNTYNAVNTMTYTNAGLTYTLVINWSYTAPNKFFTWTYTLTVPSGNTQNVKFYYGQDSYVAGADANDVGYYTNTGGQTVGIYDSVANVLSAQRYLSGQTWAGYIAGPYTTVSTQTNGGTNYDNTIQTTGGDLGYGINWDFGTTPGTYSSTTEWRLLPYVSASIPDLIPGIGQPVPGFTVNQLSQIPIIVTNAGNATATGTTNIVFTVPTNFTGPSSAYMDNGWSCGAMAGSTVTCTKSGDIVPLSSDTVQIPVTPLPAAGNTNAILSVSISNTSDSNVTNNTANISLQVNVATQTRTLWLKANTGTSCNTNGCSLATWDDQSGLARHAIQGTTTSQPLYITNAVNGNPAVNFNSSAKVLSGISGTQQTIFAVRNLDVGAGYHTLFASAANTDFSIRSSSTTYNGTTDFTYENGPNAADWSNATGTPTNFWVDGKQTLTGKKQYHIIRTSAATAITNTYSVSSNFMSRGMTGNDAVAELIAYNNIPTATTINSTESYLAIKYGITLDQTTARNYILSDSGIIWDAMTAGVYKNDIAGIATDTVMGLNQIRSQSINSSGDIIVEDMSLPLIDKSALTWANDAGGIGNFVTTDAPVTQERITREWKFQEKNTDTGNIKISYPASALPGGFAGTLKMYVDSDGVFAAGTTTYIGTLNAGNYEFTVNIANGNYITFGHDIDSTPPVINSISIASGTLLPIGNFPITVNYSDTGSAINPGSLTGALYAWNAGAWSSVNIAGTSMTLSGVPSSSGGGFQIQGLPSGKYRVDISIADAMGNTLTQSYTYYVDGILWNVSSDQYDIGTLTSGVQTFGPGEMIVTVQTVGAGFSLKLISSNPLIKGGDTVNYWNGTLGWGYDAWNGTSYPGTIITTGSSTTIVTQGANINTQGIKNTYTYRIKYGAKVGTEQSAGLYQGNVRFDLVVTY